MFSFFRRGKTAGKHEEARGDGGKTRTQPTDGNSPRAEVAAKHRVPEGSNTLRKDVINLLIPPTDYGPQKTGVTAIIQNIMAGKRRNRKKNRHKNKLARAESYKEISTGSGEEHAVNLYRSHSQLDRTYRGDVEAMSAPVSETDLTYDVVFDRNTDAACAPPRNDADPANFVKELVLQKYKNKSPQPKRQHVSLVYVSNEPTEQQKEAEKQHAASLLREIAKKINCDLTEHKSSELNKKKNWDLNEQKYCELNQQIYCDLNEQIYCDVSEKKTDINDQMGAADSKNEEDRAKYERRNYVANSDDSMNSIKDDLKNELEKLLKTNESEQETDTKEAQEIDVTKLVITEDDTEVKEDATEVTHDKLETETEDETKSLESPELTKKSNLKPPRSDTEGCSDDDRSDCGKKKVTFRKTIDFDDGDHQTDDEVDSSFESLASSEDEEVEEEEEEEDNEIPDNDELLGGVVVTRNDEKAFHQDENQNAEAEWLKSSESDSEKEQDKRDSDTETSDKKYYSDKDEIQRISSDNSDSGFLEICEKVEGDVKVTEESETESETEEEVTDSEEAVSEEEVIVEEPEGNKDNLKNLVNQEDTLSAQVAHLSELANSRCGEAERSRELLASYRKEIEARDHEIEQLKSDLAAAYKESELIRQRSRSLEDELVAARSCSADLAGKLSTFSDDVVSRLRSELETAHARITELEARAVTLERDRARLERERHAHEQKALEAVAAAEASSTRWKAAHESARSQAAARAERLLADCEWKMRELEKRARDAEKRNAELTAAVKKAEASTPSASNQAELQQLRGLASEQQRSVQALSSQMQRLEAREDALKVEVHRLRELLEKEAQVQREREERHSQTVARLEAAHSKRVETVRSELSAQHAATRCTLERAHAERTRAALAQLRAEHERDERNYERKMREQLNKYTALSETLSEKEQQFEQALAEARSKADWELLQLRHLLDKADINYANNLDKCNERHESECERLNAEWAERLRGAEEAAERAAGEARGLLERTRAGLEAERCEQVNRLKEQHRKEMDDQWETFVRDKESCLARMKLECRQEGEEERTQREKDMREEIADLKAQIANKATTYEELSNKAAACERTLAVTEQELREALEREKQLRTLRSEDAEKLKQAKSACRNEVEHLQRKCACLRKLFDDMRARLAAREKTSADESRTQQREIQQLRAEVARLTKILVEQSSPTLGARTRADGCDFVADAEPFLCETGPQACESQPTAPRRKGGTLRTPEPQRRRPTAPEPLRPLNLKDLKPVSREDGPGRRRAKSVDLPAVQVPVRIKQLEDRNK